MPILIDLPPELEAAARAEAERRRIPVEQLFLQGAIAQLPGDACPAVIRNLFTKWHAEWKAALAAEPMSEEDEELDDVPPGNATTRPTSTSFPPELKGVTW